MKLSRSGLISVGIYVVYALLLILPALLIFDGMTAHLLMVLSTIPGGIVIGVVDDFVVHHFPTVGEFALALSLSIASYLVSIVIAYVVGVTVGAVNRGIMTAMDRLDKRFIDRLRREDR